MSRRRSRAVAPPLARAHEDAAGITRDDLLTLMRAWGWTLTGSLANGRADLWSHPGGMDEVVLPNDETAPDYGRLLRGAEGTVARAEGPRLLAVVCEVAGLAEGLDDWPAVGANSEEQHQIDTENSIARDLWKILAPLTGTHTEETR